MCARSLTLTLIVYAMKLEPFGSRMGTSAVSMGLALVGLDMFSGGGESGRGGGGGGGELGGEDSSELPGGRGVVGTR